MQKFDWDEPKARRNLLKHGVSFEEATLAFGDPLSAVFEDPDHSIHERREILVGHSTVSRLLVVTFTERNGRVRIISARKATRRERLDHEERAN